MADIDIYINAAPISLTVSAAQGPAGEAGSSTLSGLTDITYYDLPANNTPLSDALDGKISTLANVTLDNGNVIDPHTYSFPDISGEFLLDSSLPLAQSNVVDLVDDLALKAPLASPAITGTWTLNGVAQQDVSTGASVSVANLTASGTVTTTGVTSGGALPLSATVITTNCRLEPAAETASSTCQLGSTTKRWNKVYTKNISTNGSDLGIDAPTTYALNLTASGTVTEGVYTVATTPTHVLGASIRVNNATGAAIGSVVAGTGTQHVVARSNGTQWICTAIIIP